MLWTSCDRQSLIVPVQFSLILNTFELKKEQTSEIMGKTDASLFKLKEEMKSQIKNEIENMGDTLGFVAQKNAV